MFPLRDTIPHRSRPVVTVLLILANVAAFLYELGLEPAALEQLIYLNGIVPRRYVDPEWASAVHMGSAEPWPFLTSMFLHGSWFHLISNVWMLWIFGDNVEDRLGPVRYLALYLATGLAAGLLHLVTNSASTVPTIGASGAIAGVMGAYFVSFPGARVLTLVPPIFLIQLPAVVFLGFWFVSQVLSGASAAGGAEAGGVAWWAHVGGFAAGVALLFVLVRGRPADRGAGDHADGRPGDWRARPPRSTTWSLLLAPALCIALASLTSCVRETPAWLAELGSGDPHTELVAAVALAHERPRFAGNTLRTLLRHVDDKAAWNRAGARNALASIEAVRPALLVEFLVLKGARRPDVVGALLPVFERGDARLHRASLELVRRHGFEAPKELLRALAAAARADPEWTAELEREVAKGPADAGALAAWLETVRPR